MSKIQGGDIMLFLNGHSIAFATNHVLEINTDLSDFDCKDEGNSRWSNQEVALLNWSVTSENIYSNDGQGENYVDLFDLMVEGTPIDAVFTKKFENQDDVPVGGWTPSDKPYKGKVIITNLTVNAPHGDYATYSAEFTGVGELIDTSKIDYLWFEPLDKAARFKFTKNQPNDVDIEYSLDGENWTFLPSGEASPLIEVGDKIYWRGELGVQTYHWSGDEVLLEDCGVGTFAVTEYGQSPAKFKVGGDVNSILTYDFYKLYDLTPYQYAFFNLFKQSTVFDISEMIFRDIKLSHYCYGLMFNNCLSLTNNIDVLPSTQLAGKCYYSMFNNCTAITTAPELPATELKEYCYHWMFKGCLSLEHTPRLVAQNLTMNQSSCYLKMFEGCRNLNKVYLDVINVDAEVFQHINSSPFGDWLKNVAVCGVVVIKPYNTWYGTYDLTTQMEIPENWVVTTNENSVDNYNIKLFEYGGTTSETEHLYYLNDMVTDSEGRNVGPINVKSYKYDTVLTKGYTKIISTYSYEYNVGFYDAVVNGIPYTQPINSAQFDLTKFDTDRPDDAIYIIIQDENNKPLAYKRYTVSFVPL